MAYSKVILNGNTLMDTTDKTVDAGSMLSGITALKNDGTTATGNIASKTSSDLTASGATVTAPAGYYASAASKSVASGTEGTPTATKGAVSNHSVTVTPSVTNTAGYISGGTKTGTGVSVNVTELESGTKSITANGTGISVSGYSAVDVAVPSSSPTLITKSITANGTYDAEDDNADGYSSVTVNVSGGGGSGLVYETGTYTPASDIARPTINFSNTHSSPPAIIYMTVVNETPAAPSATMMVVWSYYDAWKITGSGYMDSTTSTSYSYIEYFYLSTSGAGGGSRTHTSHNSSETGSSSTYPSYYATESNFKPLGSTSRYWLNGKTYKWIAVWAPTT